MDYKDLLEHHNPYHDRFGRFTWASGAAAALGRASENKARLKYQKAREKEKETKLKLKADRKIARSKRKAMKAEAKAKVREYKQKAAIAKGKTQVDKTFELTERVEGKTAKERIANIGKLRESKKFEIQEAVDSGDIKKVVKYKDLMTPNEIQSAMNRINLNQSVEAKQKELRQNRINKIIGTAETAADYANRAYKIKKTVDIWKRESDKSDLISKYDDLKSAQSEVMKSLLKEKAAKEDLVKKASDAYSARKDYYDNPNSATKKRNDKATSAMNASKNKYQKTKDETKDAESKMNEAQNIFNTAKERFDFEGSLNNNGGNKKKK